jgi:hypothetical protein
MRTKAWLSLFLVAAWHFSPAAPTDQWTQWQRDAQHSGAIHESMLLGQRSFSWSTKVSSYAITGLAATDQYVVTIDSLQTPYAGSQIATLAALDIQSGSIAWTNAFPSGTIVSAPSCADGMVFVIENQIGPFESPGDRFLDAFAIENGMPIYRAPLSTAAAAIDAPTISDGHVYFESPIGSATYSSVYQSTFGSANEQTGQMEWQSSTANGDGIVPTVAGDFILGATTTLNVLDAATGQTLASDENTNGSGVLFSSNAPAIAGDSVLLNQDGSTVAFSLQSGLVNWSISGYGAGHVSTDGLYAFYLAEGALEVRDVASGALLWGWEPPNNSGPAGSGALAENMIVADSHVVTTDGVKTYFIDRTSHLQAASYSIAGLLAYANDRVLIAGTSGVVTAIHIPTDELFRSTFE